MAGTDTRFNATRFRNGIKFAMEMAFPDDETKRFTWHWTTKRTYTKQDSGDFPFEWNQSQVASEPTIDDLQVDVAVKFQPVGSESRVGGTDLGIFDLATIQATLLDTEYETILDHGDGRLPDQATVDGSVYVVQMWQPPLGLFEVTIYQVLLQAVDET